MNSFQIARRLIPRQVRSLMRQLVVRAIFRFGLTHMELAALSDEVANSTAGRRWNTDISRGIGGRGAAPNRMSTTDYFLDLSSKEGRRTLCGISMNPPRRPDGS